MLQGAPAAAVELALWAALGALTWLQFRRWKDGAATGGGTTSAAPAVAPDSAPQAEAAREAATQEVAHAIVDAAEEEAKQKVHIVGSSVNIPDMSANLKAKVTVSEEQQSDPRLLAAVYDDMAAKFQQHGLNLPAVEAMRQYFENLEGEGEAVPLEYARFPTPLPPWSTRLGVIFFQECNSRLTEMVWQAAQEVIAALPEGFKAHANKPSHYHITVYMSSQPHTMRPDPFDPSSSSRDQAELALAQQDPMVLNREVEVFRAAAAGSDAPQLEVHRLVMADSGTLLLCSVDHTGNLAKLRRRIRTCFPGGPPKQSTIVHASIARVLTAQQLTPEQIEKVQAVCDKWSERIHGMTFNPERIYYIQEHTFTTVEGPRMALPFKRKGGNGLSSSGSAEDH